MQQNFVSLRDLLYFFCNQWPKKFTMESITPDMLLSKFFTLKNVKNDDKKEKLTNDEVVKLVQNSWNLKSCLETTDFRNFFSLEEPDPDKRL